MINDLCPIPMYSFFPENSGEFLSLSLPGLDNPPCRAEAEAVSPFLINSPLSMMQTSLTPLLTPSNPLLTPYTAFGHIANTNVYARANTNENEKPGVPQAVARSPRGRARLSPGKSITIPPPFPWATDERAVVHSLKYLLQNNIVTITGKVQCKRCDERFEMKLDLVKKLGELLTFIESEKGSLHDRTPTVWSEPVLPTCQYCQRENSVAPFLADTKKKAMNWLFLFLSQMLSCCTIKHLKYFCKHTNSHRTGAKDRLVYSVYMTLCNQLLPEYFNFW